MSSAPAIAHDPGKEPRCEAGAIDLLILLMQRKIVILGATLAAAALAAVVALVLPNRYRATADILPPQPSQSLATSMIGQLGALGPVAAMAQKDFGLKNPNDLYVGMLRSRTAEERLILRFDLQRVYGDKKMSDAREDLEKASRITSGKEGFVSITIEDRDPKRAPAIANAYVDELRRLTQELAVTEAGERRMFFEGQLKIAQDDLSGAEQSLKETQQKTGLIQLDGQAKAVIESVVKLQAAVATKEVELHAMRLFSTEDNPDLRLAEEQLSGLRAELGRLEKQTGGAEESKTSADGAQVTAGSVPEAGLEYVRKVRAVKYAETLFELLAKQYEAARLDEAKTAAVIQVLDPAVEPDRKSAPQRTLIVALGALLGLFASVSFVLVAEALARLRLNAEVEARWTVLKSCIRSSTNPSRA